MGGAAAAVTSNQERTPEERWFPRDPLGPASLKVPERITSRDPESARTAVARKLSAHSLSTTGSPTPFGANLASGDAGAVRLLEIGYDTDVRIRRASVNDYIGIVIPLTGWLRIRLADST